MAEDFDVVAFELRRSQAKAFDALTPEGKLSAIYFQILEAHTKINDVLAKLAHIGPAS